MDTIRIDICYRPLRIAWAIGAGDRDAFRKAVRLNHTLWGGRFNPIVIADRADEAAEIIEAFRADMIIPIGESEPVKAFPKRFPHLINPLFHDELFVDRQLGDARAQVLDIHNALVHLRHTPEWKAITDRGIRLYSWSPDDPLADVFLIQLGAYPDITETGIDYRDMLKQAGDATEQPLDQGKPLPPDIVEHVSIAYLSRQGIERHYSLRSGWDYPGFFFGDASNLDDLIWFWNLRATDNTLHFVDRHHLTRYAEIIPAWQKIASELLAMRREKGPPGVAIWSQPDTHTTHDAQVTELKKVFGDGPWTICNLDQSLWNGRNLRAPMMILGEVSQLGVLVDDREKPKLSFALTNKPFCGDAWFHSQHLVASLSFIGGLYGDDLHTLNPPYVPELNEFYGRTMHFRYNTFRVEPERIGLVIDAADADAFVYALPTADLFERLFDLAGVVARPSTGGLITRQLLAQVGGLRGAAVFKVPGARRLLKTYGPTDAFTAKSALQLIGGKDETNPDASFKDYEDLYIEARPHDTKLTPKDVLAYLVEKGLFRIGAQLNCPHCRMTSWTALDHLKQRITCEMCGRGFDATRQLVNGEYHYRRSGVLGGEKNAQGAVPVALTLQQLDSNLTDTFRDNMYSTSLELTPKSGSSVPRCEVDFVWLVTGTDDKRVTIILGECKDRGRNPGAASDGGTINPTDIANLKHVADAFPRSRFSTYVLLSKLCPFTPDEIAAAKAINAPYRARVILLTARELEPWHIYDRTKSQFKVKPYAGTARDLAQATAAIYFADSTAPAE